MRKVNHRSSAVKLKLLIPDCAVGSAIKAPLHPSLPANSTISLQMFTSIVGTAILVGGGAGAISP